jgi:hypothetical protein
MVKTPIAEEEAIIAIENSCADGESYWEPRPSRDPSPSPNLALALTLALSRHSRVPRELFHKWLAGDRIEDVRK